MVPNLKLLDSSKLTGRLSTNFACELSHDDRIFVVCESNLYVLTLRPDLNSTFPQYTYHKVIIEPSAYVVCDHIDIDINSFIHDLPKDVLYEVMARVELSQNLQSATPSTINPIQAQWSDSNMVDSAFSMLGVLTNLYSLEIYIRRTTAAGVSEYKPMLNLTKAILDKRKSEFVYSNKMPPMQKIRELKKRVEYISPLTFTWGHTFECNMHNCTVVFIGHFNGEISIWRVHSASSCDQTVNREFLYRYSSKLGNISTLFWYRTEPFGGVLCAGDSIGKISVLYVKNLEQTQCRVEEEVELCSETDCKVDKLIVTSIKSSTVLIAVKQCHLFFYGIDITGRVFDLLVHDVGNYYITGLTYKGSIIKVLTFTGVFKLLELVITNQKILVTERVIPIKHEFAGYRTHGFIESNNKVFYGILLHPSHFRNAFRGKKFITFCLFNDTTLNPIRLLLDNKTGSLRTFWDCLETLRIICLKEQRFPWLGIKPDLDLDTCSTLELKTLRLIAKISETVFVIIKRIYSYDIKPYVLLHYLVDIKLILQRLTELFTAKDKGVKLSLIQLQSIDLQVLFLKELIANGILPKAQVGKTFIQEITHILKIANELEYPDMVRCTYCGEKLIGATCLPPHADSRCTFTMMPILLAPAYKCFLCHVLANRDIETNLQAVICPYCDYPMERICLEENLTENLGELLLDVEKLDITSECASDCIRDSCEVLNQVFLDLEDSEPTSEGSIHISDDDDIDSSNTVVRELYFNTLSMTLNCSETSLNENN